MARGLLLLLLIIIIIIIMFRTNPTAKQLHTVMVRGTAVDVTGCIILLQFCPKLTKVFCVIGLFVACPSSRSSPMFIIQI